MLNCRFVIFLFDTQEEEEEEDGKEKLAKLDMIYKFNG